MWPILIIAAQPQRTEVLVSITDDCELIRSELERDWRPRRPEDAELCRELMLRRNSLLYHWDIKCIDIYDQRHPGHPAIKIGRHGWERLPADYWLQSGAPITWLTWHQRDWMAGMRARDHSTPHWFWGSNNVFDDPKRQERLPMPWEPEKWLPRPRRPPWEWE